MLKAKPVGAVAEREKMPFEVTPFMLYLTREINTNSSVVPGAVSADSKSVTVDKGATAVRNTSSETEAAGPRISGRPLCVFVFTGS